MVDKAFKTYQSILAAGLPISGNTISILLDACARGKQPARGQEIWDTEIPKHAIELTVAEWNSLLSVYKEAGDMV